MQWMAAEVQVNADLRRVVGDPSEVIDDEPRWSL
jgi:hypothetical protein